MKRTLPGTPLPNETKRAYPKEWERGPKTPEQGINDPKLEDFSERLKKEAEPEKLKHEDLNPGEHMIDEDGALIVKDHVPRYGNLFIFPNSKRVYPKEEEEIKIENLKNGEYWIDKSDGLALNDHNGTPYYFPKMKRVYPKGSWPPADEDMKLHYTEACERLKKAENMVLDVEAKARKEIDEVCNEIIKVRADAEYQADLNTKLTEELNKKINDYNELQVKVEELEKSKTITATALTTGNIRFCINYPPVLNHSCNDTAFQNINYLCQVNATDQNPYQVLIFYSQFLYCLMSTQGIDTFPLS